jgi:7,8-dihydro-6-hydroxymethylpterin-pyrophosphokinase
MTAKARPMNGTLQERWMNLVGQGQEERDPQKLTEVLAKIDRMLQEKQARLNGESPRSNIIELIN